MRMKRKSAPPSAVVRNCWPRRLLSRALSLIFGGLGVLPLAGQTVDPAAWQSYLDRCVALDLFPGIITMQFTPSQADTTTAGLAVPADGTPPDAQTFFQIGELTSIFTVAAAQELVNQRQLSWDTRAGAFLPANAQPPAFDDLTIRLRHLATHSSNLPPLPLDLRSEDPRQPFADYNAEDLHISLKIIARLNRPPGTEYQFSMMGMGLLGHILELRSTQPYGAIIRDKVAQPLGLEDLTAQLSPEQAKRLATPHKARTPIAPWDYGVFAGAGQLFATPETLVAFARAAADWVPSPLSATFQTMRIPVLPASQPQTEIGFGWHITTIHHDPILWQSGQTGGHAAFLGIDLYNQRGVVVLTNGGDSVEGLGFYLLAPDDFPLPPLPQSTPLEVPQVQRLTGVYETEAGITIRARREGTRLYIKIGDTTEHRVYATTPTHFTFRHEAAELHFPTGNGRASHVTLVQGHRAVPARRIAETSP